MQGLPVVEHLITVVNDVEVHTDEACSEQQHESKLGADGPATSESGLCRAASKVSEVK